MAYLPCHEANRFDDGGLYDLLSWEHTPSDGVRTIGVSVCTKIASLVDDVVGDIVVALDVVQQQLEELRVDEEFEISLETEAQVSMK